MFDYSEESRREFTGGVRRHRVREGREAGKERRRVGGREGRRKRASHGKNSYKEEQQQIHTRSAETKPTNIKCKEKTLNASRERMKHL